jgi:hypothetical protein
MILHIHSDTSYLSENEAKSRSGGFFYMGNTRKNDRKLTNGATLIISKVLKHMMSSAAEAEIGAVFLNAKEGAVLRTTLEELGHKQPPIPMETDNNNATGYTNGTIKQKTYKSHGHALLLDQGSSETRPVQNLLRPSFSKFGGLFHKTPFAGTYSALLGCVAPPYTVYTAVCNKSLTSTYQCKISNPSNKVLVNNN